MRIDTLPPEKRGFGMVFQNYALFPHMSVARNVGFGLKMRGVDSAQIDRRVENALKADFALSESKSVTKLALQPSAATAKVEGTCSPGATIEAVRAFLKGCKP